MHQYILRHADDTFVGLSILQTIVISLAIIGVRSYTECHFMSVYTSHHLSYIFKLTTARVKSSCWTKNRFAGGLRRHDAHITGRKIYECDGSQDRKQFPSHLYGMTPFKHVRIEVDIDRQYIIYTYGLYLVLYLLFIYSLYEMRGSLYNILYVAISPL